MIPNRHVARLLGRTQAERYEDFIWYKLSEPFEDDAGELHTDVLMRIGSQAGKSTRSGVGEVYAFLPELIANPQNFDPPAQLIWDAGAKSVAEMWKARGYKLVKKFPPQPLDFDKMVRKVQDMRVYLTQDTYHFGLDYPWGDHKVHHVLVAIYAPYSWSGNNWLGGAVVTATNKAGSWDPSYRQTRFPGCSTYEEALLQMGYHLVPSGVQSHRRYA